MIMLPTPKERIKFLKTYGSLFSCRPPPFGMVILVLMQVGMFVFYTVRQQEVGHQESIVTDTMDSMWIYDPKKREEAYRFLTYAVLHKDLEHMLGNVCIGLVVGFLETVISVSD